MASSVDIFVAFVYLTVTHNYELKIICSDYSDAFIKLFNFKTMLKRIISLFVFVFFLTTTQKLFGQELLSTSPTTKEEFVASEKSVIATIDWLEITPFDIEKEKRNVQKALLVGWITNSPTVTLEINASVLTFTKKNPDLMVIFMGGWTKFCLQNNYSSDNVKGSLAGIKSAIKVYKNLSLKKDKEMERLIELNDKGELENWVKSKMATK